MENIADTVNSILGQPAKIRDAAEHVAELKIRAERSKQALMDQRHALLLADPSPIDGKNAEIREAQLQQHTVEAREALQAVEEELMRHQTALEFERNTMSGLKAIAYLVAATSATGVEPY